MAYLVDTNVLVRLAAGLDPLHQVARSAIRTLETENEELFAAGQNFIELWNVATRPTDRNGLGRIPKAADLMLSKLEPAFPRLAEPFEVYNTWRDLVVHFGISGVQVHDARLVAVMLVNEIPRILTFNTRDFKRFVDVGIEASDPRKL